MYIGDGESEADEECSHIMRGTSIGQGTFCDPQGRKKKHPVSLINLGSLYAQSSPKMDIPIVNFIIIQRDMVLEFPVTALSNIK